MHIRATPAVKNEAITENSTDFRIGDPFIWNNNGVEERGTIKFIGYLKGHKSVYAGVEFKNRIGAGTGIFDKQQLFVARDGHAGFVELSTLEPVTTPTSTSSSSGSSTSSSSSSSTAAGASRSREVGVAMRLPPQQQQQHIATVNVPYREQLVDPPSYTPPPPPRSSSAQSAPPPIPPKPYSAVEDFLIDSYEIGKGCAYNFSTHASKIDVDSEEFKTSQGLLNNTFSNFSALSINVSENFDVLTDMARRSRSTKNQVDFFEKMEKFISKSKSINAETDSEVKKRAKKLEENLKNIKEWYESKMENCVDESEVVKIEISKNSGETDA